MLSKPILDHYRNFCRTKTVPQARKICVNLVQQLSKFLRVPIIATNHLHRSFRHIILPFGNKRFCPPSLQRNSDW